MKTETRRCKWCREITQSDRCGCDPETEILRLTALVESAYREGVTTGWIGCGLHISEGAEVTSVTADWLSSKARARLSHAPNEEVKPLRVERVEADAARLRTALLRYGEHWTTCDLEKPVDTISSFRFCTCGLSDAIDEPARTTPEEQKGACPECGCEELDHRGLWTCQCPARTTLDREPARTNEEAK